MAFSRVALRAPLFASTISGRILSKSFEHQLFKKNPESDNRQS